MKTEKYNKLLEDLKKNIYIDEDPSNGKFIDKNVLRIEKSFLFGKDYPIMQEDVLLQNYKEKIKEVLKNLRNYPNGRPNSNLKIVNLAPLFSPAFLEYELKFKEDFEKKYKNASPLKLSGWSETYQQGDSYELNLEIPLDSERVHFARNIIEFAKTIDKKIAERINPKRNSLVGKLKRKSLKKSSLPQIKFNYYHQDPRLETFLNRSPDVISGGNFNSNLYDLN